MGKRKQHKKMVMSRRNLIIISVMILVIGLLFGWMIFQAISAVKDYPGFLNPSLCMIVFALILLLVWLPMFTTDNQVYDITSDSIRILPSYTYMKKWQVIGYILCNDTIEPFLRVVPFHSIQYGALLVERHAGLYGMSRYSFLLKLMLKEEKLMIYINPLDNGVVLPSGQGGSVLCGYQSKDEICNMLTFLTMSGVTIEDPYQLQMAWKDPDIVLYDYLEAQKIKVLY